MINVVGISFKPKGKVYYFLPNNLCVKKNLTVVVQTERGLQFGKVENPLIIVDEKKCKGEMKSIIRIASKGDYLKNQKNISDSIIAVKKCRELVEKNNLNMQIIDASFTLDRSQLMFRFLADNRVDFRNLAKELAGIYKTRIELRQVGARDKAKEIGGCGLCGRKLCCSKFLDDLDSVSINMAKNQCLSLNPNKINGLCGRLLCCLKYEDECYCECRKCLPELNKKVTIAEGTGKVVSIDILKKKYKVDIPNIGIVEVECDKRS